jgi:hypothetical protein
MKRFIGSQHPPRYTVRVPHGPVNIKTLVPLRDGNGCTQATDVDHEHEAGQVYSPAGPAKEVHFRTSDGIFEMGRIRMLRKNISALSLCSSIRPLVRGTSLPAVLCRRPVRMRATLPLTT